MSGAAALGELLAGGLYSGGLTAEGFRLDGGDTIGLGERPWPARMNVRCLELLVRCVCRLSCSKQRTTLEVADTGVVSGGHGQRFSQRTS